MAEIDFTIRSATNADRSRLANLIHFGAYIHQHLDWRSAIDWIGNQPYLMLERGGNIYAALACPPELPDITWIRLFAVSTNIPVDRAWKLLWEATQKSLLESGYTGVAALSLQNWFNLILEKSGFIHKDNVIVLMWESLIEIPPPQENRLTIRPMFPEDMDTVVAVDNSAFELEWRNSTGSLEVAYQQSSIATVAEYEGEIVGYQYSTTGPMGGHLARLAVKPSMQGKGIGYSLVYDVLHYFRRMGIMRVTVNTQQKNTTSLALYAKAGFRTTGESYRVYQTTLS